MKAAVITRFGEIPQYRDFPEPVPVKGGKLMEVKACVLENFDKLAVSGKHYSSKQLYPQFPAVIGSDGIGTTREGRLVAFREIQPPYGAFAEKVMAGHIIPLPDGIDPASAAALTPSVLTSLLPLKYSARLQKGETVLINGATGASGRIAVQVAKLLGAGKIIGTGRNESSLKLLSELGADVTIDLKQEEQAITQALLKAGGDRGYDVVIDFLWGRPAEILINTFIPKEAGFAKRKIRYIQMGEKAGQQIALPASALRTSGLELMGVGKISQDILQKELRFTWKGIQKHQFYMEIEKIPLADIAQAWQRQDLSGKRLVIVP